MTPLATTCDIDAIDQRLLTALQKEIPLQTEPFKPLAETLGLSVPTVLERLARLKSGGIIRQMGAIFDTRTLGYQSTLVAMKAAPERADAAAVVINAHPGVSHNYKRNHAYNLWFTIAVPPSDSIEDTVALLHQDAGAVDTIVLPTLRLYKIGVKLDLTGQESKQEPQEEIYNEERRQAAQGRSVGAEDIAAIRLLQEDVPLVERPFAAQAAGTEWTEDTLLAKARELQSFGFMRRFAAILNHRNAGFKANAMVVWQVAEEAADTAGAIMAQYREVSHCYRRPVFPAWPYALFTMIHAPTYSACMDVVNRIMNRVGQLPHKNLFSTKEYKKIRLKYFSQELDEWWQQHACAKLP